VLAPELRGAIDAGGGLRTLSVIDDLDEIEPSALLGRRQAWVAGDDG
jgi:hypothetical protein